MVNVCKVNKKAYVDLKDIPSTKIKYLTLCGTNAKNVTHDMLMVTCMKCIKQVKMLKEKI